MRKSDPLINLDKQLRQHNNTTATPQERIHPSHGIALHCIALQLWSNWDINCQPFLHPPQQSSLASHYTVPKHTTSSWYS
jgi:hypothetical protein